MVSPTTALSSSVNTFLLYTTLVKRGHFKPDLRLKHRAWRLAVAAVTMGLVLLVSENRLMPYVHGAFFTRIGAMVALVGGGVCVYGVAAVALGAFSRADLALLTRRRPVQ